MTGTAPDGHIKVGGNAKEHKHEKTRSRRDRDRRRRYADDKADSTSDRTPGHQMQQDKAAGKDIDKGASTYAPGQQMRDGKAEGKDVDRGASKYTPSRDNNGASGSSTGE